MTEVEVENRFGLTELEVEIVRSLCAGRTKEAAAIDLGLNRFTLADHVKAIYRKMGVFSKVTMAVKAQRAGLLEGVRV